MHNNSFKEDARPTENSEKFKEKFISNYIQSCSETDHFSLVL